MIAMIGTSDRLCWLAETCKILLLLLLQNTLYYTSCQNGGGICVAVLQQNKERHDNSHKVAATLSAACKGRAVAGSAE